MRNCAIAVITVLASLLLVHTHARAQEVSSEKVKIEIASCVVYSLKSAGKKYDCIAEARKALGNCSEVQSCEIPIGFNLTSGRDLEPGGGFLSRMVTIKYICGSSPMQSGPYQQDDHASVVLDCSGMWW